MSRNHELYVMQQVKQQERIVSQLVEIVAKTNDKVKTLQQRVEQLESIKTINKV